MEKQIQSFDGRSNKFPIKESCAYLEERKKKQQQQQLWLFYKLLPCLEFETPEEKDRWIVSNVIFKDWEFSKSFQRHYIPDCKKGYKTTSRIILKQTNKQKFKHILVQLLKRKHFKGSQWPFKEIKVAYWPTSEQILWNPEDNEIVLLHHWKISIRSGINKYC